MEYLVWKKGISPTKSFKKDNIISNPQKLALVETNKEVKFEANVNYDKQINNNSERENLNNKLSNRYLIQQINQNPFNTENSYLNDLHIQEKYLRPKSSYESSTETV